MCFLKIVISITPHSYYDYNYQNTGFIIKNINPQTGELDWINAIKDEEPKTKNDNGEYLSYLYFFEGDNLAMLYNEPRDIRKAKIHNPLFRPFPIIAVYDKSGKLVSKKALLAAGIGVKAEFELATSTLLKIDEKTYIIRAKSRAEYKYGYMKFN